jgi:Beta-1,4-xylanase
MNSVMSETYLKLWNREEQKRIDADIETYRKADATVKLEEAAPGTEVEIRQLKHSFVFGAHIFNFNQLGKDEYNARYKELYGTLFNSATVAFYWKKFEPEEGKPRFKAEFRDTAEYWNTVADPKNEPHWRRPATDPVVEFCESKGIRIHGHPLVWGHATWQYPLWLAKKLPERYSSTLRDFNRSAEGINYMRDLFDEFSAEQLDAMFPEYRMELHRQIARRITEIALHYRGRINSWDVVNESAVDFRDGRMVPGSGLCKSSYGLMPGDYTCRFFKTADGVFPEEVKLNINDYLLEQSYVDQVKDLLGRRCRVDIMGAQMHLFQPQICQDIADGKSDRQSPAQVRETMGRLAQAGLPIHLSEITIASPTPDERGQEIQAMIARNLYRLWFSLEKTMGITWWNVVDDCGAPGEPNISGLFTRDMKPKKAYYALNELIHNEWKTNLSARTDKDGAVSFRGFRGEYELNYRDASGLARSRRVTVE